MIRFAMVIAHALIVALASHTAHAQGTHRLLPDPITTDRLSQYADLLNLSPQQRHAMEPLHAAYREA